ncbi:uncharacterized protein VTP21DRAFT_9633 [Calcarisporiella thermophila]|uniref:uncharacterized protein n=1 Tax=Calcarisporiella thermophila TaxID=911321 RepID=UPI003741FC94
MDNATVNPLEVFELQQEYIAPIFPPIPIVLTHGRGCYVYDAENNKYLDFMSGIAVNALGHADKEISQIISDQAGKLIHTSTFYINEWAGRLAKSLISATNQHITETSTAIKDDLRRPSKVIFVNSGSEANEAALKMARKFAKHITNSSDPSRAENKYKVVSFQDGYHGSTMGALSMSALEIRMLRDPFRPMLSGSVQLQFNNVEKAVETIDENTCAVIVEPIQGGGGIHIATYEFLKALRKRCDEVNAILIYDEVQCGLGRSGKLWAHMHYGADCAPDIITVAKALGNGLPIGAVILSERVAKIVSMGDHGSTFGGNPLSCRVGHYVFNRLSEHNFLQKVQDVGNHLLMSLQDVCKPFYGTLVEEVRGRGMMIAIQFCDQPNQSFSTSEAFLQLALQRFLLVIPGAANTITILPPLILTKEQADSAIATIEECLKVMANSSIN